jgi:hypothetical protein
MITLQDALTVNHFYHVRLRNADGTALRCRRNGATETWKTRPGQFRVPVKYGLRECFYLDNGNAADWTTDDPTTEIRITDPKAAPRPRGCSLRDAYYDGEPIRDNPLTNEDMPQVK